MVFCPRFTAGVIKYHQLGLSVEGREAKRRVAADDVLFGKRSSGCLPSHLLLDTQTTLVGVDGDALQWDGTMFTKIL